MNSSQIEETLNTSNDEVQFILSTLLNMHMWNENSEKLVITAVNKLLTVSKTHLQGLEFLNLIIDNCSSTVISENGIFWMSHCLIKHPGDYLKELKLTTIGKIVHNSNEEQEFSKKFVSDHMSKVFEICLSTHSNFQETEAALKTLAICMKYYGSWFGPHKLRIENYIINFLEHPSEQVVENAALAFHFLQQVGGMGTDGNNHSQSFSVSFEKLCATVQEVFDKFFENETEMHLIERSTQNGFKFSDLPHHSQKMLHINARRIKSCLKFIMTMLSKGFPVVKELRPGDVINIVYRGTSIHHCLSSVNDKSLDDFQFSILLHQIQIDLLRLLHILIVWLHGSALPFTFIITKILTDCLTRSQSCRCYKTDSLFHEMVYKALSCWIRISRCAIHSHFQTQLIKCILKDIVPVTNTLTLNLQNDISNKSKKAKQKIVQEKIILSGQTSTSNKELTNAEIVNRENKCGFALDTLKHILIGTILKVNSNILEELYTSIINILADIQISKLHHPYKNKKCQAKLYEVLVAFYEQDLVKVLPPIQLAINILSRGLNSTDRTISLSCEHGLNIVEKICVPVCPSILASQGITSDNVAREPVTFAKANDLIRNSLDEINTTVSTTEQLLSGDESDEQLLNAREISKNVPCDKVINLDILNITADNEVDAENNDEVEEELTVTVVDNENGEYCESGTSLRQEPSVHIIDMQIIKSCPPSHELRSQDSFTVDEERGLVNLEPPNETPPILSAVSEILETNEYLENEGPPPLKRMKIDEAVSVTKTGHNSGGSEEIILESSLRIKSEIMEQSDVELGEQENIKDLAIASQLVKSESFEDDIFADDFVDIVKEY